MSTHPIERVLNPRNILRPSHENFEKNFLTSLRKAINNVECPVKEKHVRRVLIGTFQTKSGQIFWRFARALPIGENQIVCWKFCHVLHKVLRDGFPKAIQDSYRFKSLLQDHGKMWGLLKQGYGKLIQNYCSLLVNKIEFHIKNPRIPGNLIISDDDLDRIGENDVNVFFQLCCEIFDYMDEILCLQNNIFNSLDRSRSNSMTPSGQCRLAPLIMCIQDSSQLYDFSVKILFKLHSALPPTTLEGHRERFLNQFKLLKAFYYHSSNLQYFQNLITIPRLPDEPPNFFIQTNLNSHVTPVVIIPQQESIETDPNLLDLTFNDDDSDKSEEVSIWSFPEENKPGVHEQNLIIEKDKIIEKLMGRIEELEIEIRRIKTEDEFKIEELKRSITELEYATAQRMEREIEVLKLETEKQKASSDAEERMIKFAKMKEFYQKLRGEHIELIRMKAETDKQLSAAKTNIEELQCSKDTLEKRVKEFVRKEAEMTAAYIKNGDLSSQLGTLKDQISNYTEKLNSSERECQELAQKLSNFEMKNEQMKTEIQRLTEDNLKNITNIYKSMISKFSKHCVDVSKRIIDQDLELGFSSVNCTPQYFSSQIEILITNFGSFETCLLQTEYNMDLFNSALNYYYQLFYTMNCSKTTIQNLPNLELSDELLSKCVKFIAENIGLSSCIDNNFGNAKQCTENVLRALLDMQRITEAAIPEFMSNKNLDFETLLSTEMEQMDRAINDAVCKIEQMLTSARQQDTGIKLEVNGKILDACTMLMQAIKQLIHDSKQLQLEIASKERGSSSMKEFYQRNHRWTEGLISAAKTVAADANLLVEIADKIIRGKGKFEELMAASQEIAAACAQLVVASRVKAQSSSQNMAKLAQSSKAVLQATGNVIATTKQCNELIEESDITDFSNLSLHQAKRLEMECQVKVLELENLLQKERLKLSSIRRTHYHLADALERNDEK